MNTNNRRKWRSGATAALTGLGLTCSVHSALALPQVTGKPAIVDIGGETVIFAVGVDGHLNIYESWSGWESGPAPGGGTQLSHHFRDTASGASSFDRVDCLLPAGATGITDITAAPYTDGTGNVVGAWLFGSDTGSSNTLQGFVRIGDKSSMGTYTIPPTFQWGNTIAGYKTGYYSYVAQATTPLVLTSQTSLDLFGIPNMAFAGPNSHPLMGTFSGPYQLPSTVPWKLLGSGANASTSYPDPYMGAPSGVAYSVNGTLYERVYMQGQTQGQVYIASTNDHGQTWSWLMPVTAPTGVKFGPGGASTFHRLNGSQEIDCYMPASNGNVYEVSNIHGNSRYYLNNLGAPKVGFSNANGPQPVVPTNVVSTSYSNTAQNKEAVYVFGLANGLSWPDTGNRSDVVMDYWLGGTGWSWNDLFAPCYPMAANGTATFNASGQPVVLSTVNAPALLTTKRSDGGQRLVVANIGNDGHMYTRTIDNDNFADDLTEMSGSSAHNWISQEPLGTVQGINLVVTSVTMTPAAPKAGDLVKLTATVKNMGPAPTPQGTAIGVQFAIDTPLMNWSPKIVMWNKDNVAALAPGQSITMTANDGNDGLHTSTWKATSGNHYVRAWVDDVHRFYEYDSNVTHHQALSATVNVP